MAARDETIRQYAADLARLESERSGGPLAAAQAQASGRVVFLCLFSCGSTPFDVMSSVLGLCWDHVLLELCGAPHVLGVKTLNRTPAGRQAEL